MRQVIMTKGLPASGKTTWAMKQLEENPGKFKRLNKDNFRAMLDGGKHTGSNEGFVLQARDMLVVASLDAGKSVIVDDTGLNPVHERSLRELVRTYNHDNPKANVQFVVKDFTDVGPEECEKRDLLRCPSVGHGVIWDMFNTWMRKAPKVREFDPELPTALLVDVDGTLAWKGDRDVYDASKAYLDKLNPAVASVLEAFWMAGSIEHVIVMSGRQEKDREGTEDWLKEHDVKYTACFMRATGDLRRDADVKCELYETHIEGKYNVLFVLDDRQQVVDMWRSLGLQCFQVAEGNY